jgi:rfaE bifunctional protein nucleotidyltransferase chain/domain
MPDHKLISGWEALTEVVRRVRASGRTIALTNGCYDILHVGHLRSLEAAHRHGDCLIVAINSDESVRRYKGREPIVPEHERAEILAGLSCVSHVFVFDEPSVDRLLEEIRPDAYCKGPEWTAENLPERETLARIGGKLVAVGDPKNHSTTELIKRIQGLGERIQAGGTIEV